MPDDVSQEFAYSSLLICGISIMNCCNIFFIPLAILALNHDPNLLLNSFRIIYSSNR